jgi:hypothetical protein
MLILLAQTLAPGDCLLTGLCGIRPPAPGVPSGVMFLATGLVLSGLIGLWRLRGQRSR